MSKIQYPPEIVAAKNMLKNFDLAEGYEKLKYVKEFGEGLLSIHKYLLDNPNSPFLENLTNLKRANARILLRCIQGININNINITADSFYFLFDIISNYLKEDIKYIEGTNLELSNVVQQFFRSNPHLTDHIITELKRIQ